MFGTTGDKWDPHLQIFLSESWKNTLHNHLEQLWIYRVSLPKAFFSFEKAFKLSIHHAWESGRRDKGPYPA